MSEILKIAVCDDLTEDRSYIEKMVRAWANDTDEPVEISSFPSAEAFLFAYEEKKDYTILLLDIEMGGMDGVALAKEIRAVDPAVQIVFVTGYSDYIAEGYEVEALHYLLKPVREEKLQEVLSRALQKYRENERMIALELSGSMELLPLREIRYLEVFRNYTTVHAGHDYTVKKTLAEFEKELADRRFYRVSRSLLVNLLQVRSVSREKIILKSGEAIPLPRGKYEELNRAIIRVL